MKRSIFCLILFLFSGCIYAHKVIVVVDDADQITVITKVDADVKKMIKGKR